MTTLQSLSLADLQDLERQIRAQKKAVKDAEHARMGNMLAEFVEDIVTSRDLERSSASDWAGFSESGVPVSIDGRAYTVSVTITDVGEKNSRTDAAKLAKASADEKGLTGDERKKHIAEALEAHDQAAAQQPADA